MIENDLEIDFKSFEDVGNFIVSLQDDLEILALHLRDAKDKISKLEKKVISLPKAQELKKENPNIDYFKFLLIDDLSEREKKMEENILNSIKISLPSKKNYRYLINIILAIGILISLIIMIRRF